MPEAITSKFNHETHACQQAAPIGIFDSGVGGLSVAKCIHQQLPNEHLIYVADSLYAPYGDKSVAFIVERVNFIADKLVELGVKAIVIACNTATVNAIDQLRNRLNIPVIGVEPAIKPAAKLSVSKKVAVLVTQATASNLRFQQLVAAHSEGVTVNIQPCPGLVERVECVDNSTNQVAQKATTNKATHTAITDETTDALLKSYLTPLLATGVDTLVLGCTHYPFLLPDIMAITGEQIKIVETAAPVTKQLLRKLNEFTLQQTTEKFGTVTVLSSKATAKQARLMSQLWQAPLVVSPL